MIQEDKLKALAEDLLNQVGAKAKEEGKYFQGIAEGIRLLYQEAVKPEENGKATENSKPRRQKKASGASKK